MKVRIKIFQMNGPSGKGKKKIVISNTSFYYTSNLFIFISHYSEVILKIEKDSTTKESDYHDFLQFPTRQRNCITTQDNFLIRILRLQIR
jgi:hypothetical protein